MNKTASNSVINFYASSSSVTAKTDLNFLKEQRRVVPQFSSSTKDFNVEPKRWIHKVESGNSTTQQKRIEDICLEIEALFTAREKKVFDSSMESNFLKGLFSYIQKYGNDAIEIITCLIVYEKVAAEVASEVLRWLGNIDHPASYQFRLWLLEQSLSSSTACVRDSATLALYNVRQISKLYSVEDETKVIDFLTQHPRIVSLLIEAKKQIRRYFAEEKLSLKVSSDYEDINWEKLVISIHTNANYSDDAFKKLSSLDENWWLDTSGGVGINLYISLKFE